MKGPFESPLNSTVDILLLLCSSVVSFFWGVANAGGDEFASGWTWRLVVLLALVPVHFLVFGWRLFLSRADAERRWTILGAGALTTIVLALAISIAMMALRNSWI